MSKTLRYPRPEKLTELTLYNHAVIEASAGTGKTYTMEHLVIELLLHTDARLEEILVVTFTERATADLKKRIRGVLETIIAAYDAPSLASRAAEGPVWEIDEEASKKLKRALFSFDVAPIYTIHGFCQRVLTEHAFQNHRLFDEEHVDADRLFDTVFAEALRREFAVTEELVPYLEAWMEGKKNALQELRDLLSACVETRHALKPHFDEVTLEAIVERFARLPTETLLARIKEGFVAQRLNANTAKAMNKRLPDLLAAVDRHAVHKSLPRLLCEVDRIDTDYLRKNTLALDRCGQWGQAVNKLLEYVVPYRAAVAQKFTDALNRRLREEKDTAGVFSYDDMLSMVWESLERKGGELIDVLRKRYKYALIDEFQDTDEVQWNIFRRIFHESARRNILYVIGDPKQAIYSFRGADVHTYVRARREILEAGGSMVHLDQNFRSTPEVIAGYNHILDQNAEKPFFSGEIDYAHPVRCGRPELALVDADGASNVPFHIIQLLAPPGQNLTIANLRHGLARQFAAEIRLLLTRGLEMHLPGEKPRPIQPRDIYVLAHKRKEGAIVGEYLRAAGVPCAFYKQDGLFQTSEARDIADLLAAVDALYDRAKRLQAWVTPFFDVPLKLLPQLENLPETHPLFEALTRWHSLAAERRFEELFSRIIETSGLLRREIFFKDGERELTNYVHIFEILLEEASSSRLNLSELLARLKAFIDGTALPDGENGNVQRLESERDAVQIMTLHKSKGLEADIVFVFGGFTKAWDSGLFAFHDEAGEATLHIGALSAPDQKRYDRERDEEDQRLLYVALTRARARVYLPFVGRSGEKLDYPYLQGPYLGLNNRLERIVSELGHGGEGSTLFSWRQSVHTPGAPRTNEAAATARLAGWQPPAHLLEAADSALPQRLERYRGRRLRLSSYSHMKKLRGGYQGHLEIDEFKSDLTPSALLALGDDALPGGAASGNFLHKVIEDLDFDLLQHHPTLLSFLADADIDALFTHLMQEHGIETRYAPYCKRIVYNTLASEVRTDDLHLSCLAACHPTIFELEFLFPIPEKIHPRLDELPALGFEVQRGYIKGFVDFVFEHQGRLYFADWKSDILERYDTTTLASHINAHYEIQARLYSIAMVKMLAIHDPTTYATRFGGFFYFFLRGMGDGQGVYHQRLSWQELLAYEQELIETAF
ncbi:MAG: UvrD-helicase domain-containing protein [Bradymonadaceae bacterium]|nr:UvrD-helicase domain-containing protein [Lujinxingiaceae bacterium]